MCLRILRAAASPSPARIAAMIAACAPTTSSRIRELRCRFSVPAFRTPARPSTKLASSSLPPARATATCHRMFSGSASVWPRAAARAGRGSPRAATAAPRSAAWPRALRRSARRARVPRAAHRGAPPPPARTGRARMIEPVSGLITTVPPLRPARVRTRPSRASAFSASRTTVRLNPVRSTSSRSTGRCVPAGSSPARSARAACRPVRPMPSAPRSGRRCHRWRSPASR